MSEDHPQELFGNAGWKEHIKQHGRSTQKSAVVCRDTQIVLNTSSSHHMSAADSRWMQWMHSSSLLSLNRALSWYEDCSHFSGDVPKAKAEDTTLTPELELQVLSWQEGKYYWSNGKGVCNILRSRLKNGVIWPPLLPVENGFTYKGTCGLPAEPFPEWTAPMSLRSSCLCYLVYTGNC